MSNIANYLTFTYKVDHDVLLSLRAVVVEHERVFARSVSVRLLEPEGEVLAVLQEVVLAAGHLLAPAVADPGAEATPGHGMEN